jgi:uncharacterized SAM-binding protein YcdF (DUF218 family)
VIRDNYSGFKQPATGNQYHAPSIQHHASSNQHPATSIQHPATSIQQPASREYRDNAMYIFKKIVSKFFFPMPMCFIISFVGLYFLWFTTRHRLGKIFISAGLCMIYLLSCGPLSYSLLNPLERKYPSREPEISAKFVVVLGGGYISNPQLPVSSQLNPFSLSRLTEGIRLYRRHPGAKIVFTGYGCSAGMADAASSVGVRDEDIIIEAESRDTKDEAKNVKPIVRESPFILVTSASHMPRAMAMFKKQGMNPAPFPVGHLIRGEHEIQPDMLFPSAFTLYRSERAVYEYLGLIWAKLRGQI